MDFNTKFRLTSISITASGFVLACIFGGIAISDITNCCKQSSTTLSEFIPTMDLEISGKLAIVGALLCIIGAMSTKASCK